MRGCLGHASTTSRAQVLRAQTDATPRARYRWRQKVCRRSVGMLPAYTWAQRTTTGLHVAPENQRKWQLQTAHRLPKCSSLGGSLTWPCVGRRFRSRLKGLATNVSVDPVASE